VVAGALGWSAVWPSTGDVIVGCSGGGRLNVVVGVHEAMVGGAVSVVWLGAGVAAPGGRRRRRRGGRAHRQGGAGHAAEQPIEQPHHRDRGYRHADGECGVTTALVYIAVAVIAHR
jgi:hypothetical protein